jgi:hypothetical protein
MPGPPAEGPAIAVPGFLLPFGHRHSLVGSSDSRCGVGPSSRSAYRPPTWRRTPTGYHVLHVRDTTGMGAPSTPGTAVFSRPDDLPDRRLPLPSGQSLHPAGASHRRGSSLRGINGGSRDSPVRSAPRLQSPDGTGTLGLSPELRTPPLPAAHVRAGPGSEHAPGTTQPISTSALQSASSLATCSLVSQGHVRTCSTDARWNESSALRRRSDRPRLANSSPMPGPVEWPRRLRTRRGPASVPA